MSDTIALLDGVKQRIIAARLLLSENNAHLVFGKGNLHASILFLGEAPGEKEAQQGIPFVGAAGKELDTLLHSIGLTLDDVYIANILKYRPPGNRNPTLDEIRTHTPFLVEQITIIQPKIICTLGNFATKFVMAGFDVDNMKRVPGISVLHGKPVEKSVHSFFFTVVPLYHPAAMLYNPSLRAVLAEDFLNIKHILGDYTKRKTLLDY